MKLASLPTLADVQRKPRAQLKCSLGTKLDRAIDSKAVRLADARALRVWADAVKDRDKWKDRRTGVKVFRSLALDPRRAEAHHVVDRSDLATRYDVRNGITLSLETHLLVETYRLRLVGTKFFWTGGRRYIDATFPVKFVQV